MPRAQRPTAVDTMPDFSGWTIGGRIQLLDKLGSGAYGKVYRGLDIMSPPDNQTYYAVKCLLKHPKGSDKERLQRRELAIHKTVSEHPNIVSYHGIFEDDRFVYVLMGLHNGGDLFGAITEKHLFDDHPDKVRTTFVQILEAVQHCHSLGIYHRDIKPENVICSSDATMVYLTDFGLSTNHTDSQEFGCGSSFYMSPECIGASATGRNAPYSNRHNDIWALGVILINLITGRNPWRLATPGDPCFDAYTADQNFLKNVLHLSDGVNDILRKVFHFPATERLSIAEIRARVDLLTVPLCTDPSKAPIEPQLDDSERTLVGKGSNGTSHSSLDSQYDLESESPKSVESPTIEASGNLLAPPGPPTRSVTPAGAGKPGDSDSSGSDGSSGPITPASKAVDPKVEIPDVSEEMGGSGSAIAKALVSDDNKAEHEPRRAAQVLKLAYQKILRA